MNYVQLKKCEIVHSCDIYAFHNAFSIQHKLTGIIFRRLCHTESYWIPFEHTCILLNVLSSPAPPTNVSISQLPARPLEGEKVTLSCLGHGHLPISSYRWYRVFGEQSVLLREDSGSVSLSVTRDMGQFRCSALNEMGEWSSDTTPVNIEGMYHYAIDVSVTIL